MKEDPAPLEGTLLWEAFKKAFIFDRGVPLLGLGQTESGKTEKSYQIGKWLMDSGETWIRMDCGKPHELLPLLLMGKKIKIISPPDCQVEITGHEPGSIVMVPRGDTMIPIELQEVIYEETTVPEETWDFVERDLINVFSFRAFFLDGTAFGSYVARVFNSLLNEVCTGDSPIPVPCFLDLDEYSEIAPSYGLIENRHQKEAASKIARVAKKLRGMRIRQCAYDQAWTDVYPNARRAFPWLMICRTPGISGKDAASLERFAPLFESLRIEEALLIWPNRKWIGKWNFPLFPRPSGVSIKYRGQCYTAKAKRKRETWIREFEPEEEVVSS
jgi:hypothetical protein